MKLFFGLFSFILVFFSFSAAAYADMRAIIIDESSLSYDLSPTNYDNSPTNYDNSATNYENSATNYDNSPTNYDNSATNYDNGMNGNKRIISPDNKFMGYYTYGQNGIINIFSYKGERIAYIPGGGHTQSIFFSQGGWCGTMGNINGQLVFGFKQQCFARFYM